MPINTKAYIEAFLKIRTKDGKIIDLKLNKPQMKLYSAIKESYTAGKPIRIVILKARQEGFSTATEAIIFKNTATEHNVRSAVVAHESDATNNLFEMFKRYYDNLPAQLKPEKKKSNAKEVLFADKNGSGLNSSIRCMTAGNSDIGRSETIQYLHLSEFAFWPGNIIDTYTSIMQAVPDTPDSMVIIESTANGYNEFKTVWDNAVAGESDFTPIFCAWWELPEYRKTFDGSRLTAEEEEIKRTYDLEDDQIAWRRWCIRNNCNGSIDKFRQEYPACPEEAFIMSGSPVFNIEKIVKRIAELRKLFEKDPYRIGAFSYEWNDADHEDFIRSDSIEFKDNKNGSIKVYEEPVPGYPYVISGDTKGEGSDYYAATVINNVTGKRVASMHMDLSNSKPFTWQIYCLGRWYNDALIGIEINFNTAPIEELTRLGYENQYVRRKYDDYTKRLEKKLGWKTDGNTRPLIIDKEVGIIENDIGLISDIETLEEAMTFVYDENGRPDAMPGKHDDLLLSEMIANEIRSQQSREVAAGSEIKMQWTDDMYEDYWNATAEMKRALIEKWGAPN